MASPSECCSPFPSPLPVFPPDEYAPLVVRTDIPVCRHVDHSVPNKRVGAAPRSPLSGWKPKGVRKVASRQAEAGRDESECVLPTLSSLLHSI